MSKGQEFNPAGYACPALLCNILTKIYIYNYDRQLE